MRISVMFSMDNNKGPYITITQFYQNFTYLILPNFVFDKIGLKLSLIVILTNFSHSSKLPAHENLQFYSILSCDL